MTEDSFSPEPAYRWVVVVAAALILGIAMGTLVNGLSAFLVPLEAHFGWERAEVSAINSAGLIGIALGGIAMGFLADRITARTVCLLGASSLSLALLIAGRADALWQFYALFFAAGALGGGALFAPVIAVVGHWFRTGAGLAIGIASAGQALGQGLVPFAAGYLIQLAGWQSALLVLGTFAAVTLVPLAFLMRDPPELPVGASGDNDRGRTLPLRLVLPAISVAALGCCTAMAVPLMHLVPLIQDVSGVGAEAGGPLLLMLVAAIAGRVFFGRLADMIGPIPAWMAATAWQTTLMIGFVFLVNLRDFWLFAPVYGFGYGGVMTGVLVSVRALTPSSRRASTTGIVLAFAWLGHALGGWQGGLFYDLTGDYFWSFTNAAFAGLLNLAIMGSVFLAISRRPAASV